MTDQKALKRRVRARMTKTGERYTAARRQVLAKSATPEPATELPPPPDPAAEFRGKAATDEHVIKRTGRPWREWWALLEAWGARDRSHTEIARWLSGEQGVDGWWAQELTVRYEMAIGRRQPGEGPGGFSIGVSKTVKVPVARLFEAFVDDGLRARWLPGVAVRTRTATPYRHARFDWNDGATRLAVYFAEKGTDRSAVTVQHEKLPDADAAAAQKAYWKRQLGHLAETLEGAVAPE
ncbi:MAG TPA: hypothetical protein VIC63_03880 [Candidatus Limnocylindria bacterium]